MKKLLALASVAGAALLLSAPAMSQEKQTLAIVVKGLDNPFFEQINLGCQQWMAENEAVWQAWLK